MTASQVAAAIGGCTTGFLAFLFGYYVGKKSTRI